MTDLLMLILTSSPPPPRPQLTEVIGDQTIIHIRPGAVRNINISRSEEGWVVGGGVKLSEQAANKNISQSLCWIALLRWPGSLRQGDLEIFH